MHYLLNLLAEEAETAVKSLTLGNRNYTLARDLLSESVGDNQALILTHMRKLLSLNPILNISDAKTLRILYDTIKTQVRSLDFLGQDCANYGPMLITVLLTNLPSELNLQVSRKCGKNIWDIQEVLDLMNLEIEDRGKVVVHKEKK